MEREGSYSWRSLYQQLWWAEGASSPLAVGLGMSSLVCGVLVTAFLSLLPFALPPPPFGELVAVTGPVGDISDRGNEIVFALGEPPRWFSYSQKAGALEVVAQAVTSGQTVEVWVRSVDLQNPSRTASVFALVVDGRKVRTYQQVARAWNWDNRLIRHLLGPIVLGVSALLASVFLLTALYEERRERRGE